MFNLLSQAPVNLSCHLHNHTDHQIPMKQTVQTERERLLSPRQASQWDPGDSDTESLAQERVYQQQLQKPVGRHDQNKHMLTQKENSANSQQGDGHANNDYLQVYDSLEVAVKPHDRREPTTHSGYLTAPTNEREER